MYKPLRPILKPYYDAMNEGKVLGMKCEECGDVEFPPLPTCQRCGSTKMEWMELGNKAIVDEIRFEDPANGGDYTFRKINMWFENQDELYCVAVLRCRMEPISSTGLYME